MPRYQAPKKDRGTESKYHQMLNGRSLPSSEKGQIAEAAVLYRLALHGFGAYQAVFDGERTDWFVRVPVTGKTYRVEVRWATTAVTHGLPCISLRCSNGRGQTKRYETGAFDFIIGYCLFNDTAYVYSSDEVKHLIRSITVAPEHAERWDKFLAC